MSLGYAEKLSYIEDVGKVGMSELFDTSRILQEKVGFFFLLPLVSFAIVCNAIVLVIIASHFSVTILMISWNGSSQYW